MSVSKLIYLYYRLTPLFVIVDVMFSAPIRASFLSSANARYAYYAFCFACSILFRYKPSLATPIAYTELTVNFTFVILAIMVPIFTAIDQIPAGIDPTFDEAKVINLGIAGAMMLFAFYGRQIRSHKSRESL